MYQVENIMCVLKCVICMCTQLYKVVKKIIIIMMVVINISANAIKEMLQKHSKFTQIYAYNLVKHSVNHIIH